ncbi:MFS transporter [Neobacillus niacini]|uniref:MFS transporter n=1 Tax=Neobacillus niacini TaxID=86668 RepID=UPI0030011671
MSLGRTYIIWMFIFFVFIQLMASMSNLGLTPLLPFIQQEQNLTIVQMGYLAAAVHLGIALFSIPSGMLVDYFRVKWMLLFGGLLVGFVCISLYLFSGYVLLLIAIFLMGIFYAIIPPVMSKGLVILIPQKFRGTAMGIKQTGVSVSAFIAAVWLPFMAVHYHWKMGYLIIGIIMVAISFIALFFRDSDGDRNQKERSLRSTFSLIQFGDVLRNDSFRTICYIVPFLFIAQHTTAAYFVVDVYERFDVPLLQAGYLLALLQIGSIIGRILFGMLADWLFLYRRELLLANILLATGLVILSFVLIPFSSLITLSILAFFIGMTSSGWNGIFTVIVAESVAVNYVGFANGVGATLGYLSAAIGTPIFGYLHNLFGGFSVPWLLMAGSMFFSAIFLYRLKRKKEQDVVK